MKTQTQQPEKRRKNPLLIRGSLAIAILSAACLVGVLSFVTIRRMAFARMSASIPGGPVFESAEKTPGATPAATQASGRPAVPAIEPTLTAWDGVGRVTILLLGLDYRDWEAGNEYSRSDTMILLTLDPLNKTAGILSIPRDMWVAIPGFQHGKINTAYYLGDAYKLPGGGPGLAVKTVEQFLGVPINYYAQIDFNAFVRFIDEIGGVKIDVPAPITVDLLGSGSATKKTLQAGVQVLPGEWALAYARNRYTSGGDFDRAQRQQQVILGIRDRILSFDMLPILLSKSNVLYDELSSGVHTNLTLDDATKLAVLASQVPKENIRQGVIGEKYVIFGRSPDNLSILIPIPDKIHVLRDEIFASSGALGPLTPGTDQEKVVAEGAKVSVMNGSRASDLASRTAQYLQSLGITVASQGNADQVTTLTSLIDHTGNPYTLKFLAGLMNVSSSKIYSQYDPNSPVDIEVILGNDWAAKNSLP
jgi:LCP family protein required for cell wall assembly